MDELEREEEVLADDAPEAELEQGLKRDLARSAARTLLRTAMALGPTKMRVGGVAAGVAHGGAEQRHLESPCTGLGTVSGMPTPRLAPRPSWDIELVVKVATVAVAGESGRKTAAKKESTTPAQSKGPFRVSPPETFLGARCSSLSVAVESRSGCRHRPARCPGRRSRRATR